MTEHDRRILGPKTLPVKDSEILREYAESHRWCAVCGSDFRVRHVHHILGGRCGRSDEPCNIFMVCYEPCHPLADKLTRWFDGKMGSRVQMPKLPLAVQLSIKLRLGELSAADLERLTALHGRTLPDVAEIPQFFVDLFRRNRPELNT